MYTSEMLLCSFGQNGQCTAFHRFHNDDLFAVSHAGFIAFTGLNACSVPIQIVDLKLDYIHFGVFSQDLVLQGGAVVIGKSDSLCSPFRFLFSQETELVVFFCNFVVFAVEPVQHEYVEVFHAAAFQLFVEKPLRIFVAFALIAG